ncbi:MAG: CheR family methyltransferase [Bacteroidota bacterium]
MAFTFFFRDRHTLEQLTSFLLPQIDSYAKIKVWDAGCAMGPEPYTFGIILCEAIGPEKYKKVSILATDIDETSNFKEIITQGVYPYSDLSRMPPNILEKYFHKIDDRENYQINDIIRNSLHFEQHDLLSLKPLDNGFNAIICKNVLLHFQPEERINVIKMFHSVLLKDGLLTTEQTQTLPEECSHLFEKVCSDANIYRKK